MMQEIGKFDKKINIIPNEMDSYMAFVLGKNLIFIANMQIMNSSLENLVTSLPEGEFKNLSQEFNKKQ